MGDNGHPCTVGDNAGMTLDVQTPVGTGRLLVSEATAPVAILLLGHGAGGGVDTVDLATLAAVLPPSGITVIRFEQPWRVAGRKVAGPPPTLDTAWRSALAEVLTRYPALPLFVGGRSAGARVACRCFAAPARGVVALSFPLHPPGRPEKSRAAELVAVAADTLVVQGSNDPFGTPSDVESAVAGTGLAGLVTLDGVGHSLVSRSASARQRLEPILATVVTEVARFILARCPPPLP